MVALPRYDKRTVVLGSTGSGKSVGACWLLSMADFNRRPWFIIDPKGDPLIEEIEAAGAHVISIHADPRKAPPGLYILRPVPESDDEAINLFLLRCWERGGCGIYIDEGYAIPGGVRGCRGFIACLTQGRSKHIQMIVLSQRPRWMCKFAFSEANYFMVYNLTLEEDREYIGSYIGRGKKNPLVPLPKHHCTYYDVDGQEGVTLAPVPAPKALLEVFEQRLTRRRKVI